MNEFERFAIDRSDKFSTENPIKYDYWRMGTDGNFSPCLSLTKPINKDGTLTKYAKILIQAFSNGAVYTKDIIPHYSTLNWQTLRYSGLLINKGKGKYVLSSEGVDYCQKLLKVISRNISKF